MSEQQQKPLSQQQLDELYKWVDTLQLSRPKKNISRDFSDAGLMAEIIAQYFPALVDIHNYPTTNSVKNKLENWKTLNNKTLSKLGIKLKQQQCQKLASSTPWQIEQLLYQFKKLCAECRREQTDTNTLDLGYGKGCQQYHHQNSSVQKKYRREFKVPCMAKVEDLREILGFLKEKIEFLEKSIQRKDADIKEMNKALLQEGR